MQHQFVKPTKLQNERTVWTDWHQRNEWQPTDKRCFSHKKTFTLQRTVVYPITLRDASITKIQETLLQHERPARFKLVERAKVYRLIRKPNKTVRDIIAGLQCQASMRKFEGPLDVVLWGLLVTEIYRPELQWKLLSGKVTFVYSSKTEIQFYFVLICSRSLEGVYVARCVVLPSVWKCSSYISFSLLWASVAASRSLSRFVSLSLLSPLCEIHYFIFLLPFKLNFTGRIPFEFVTKSPIIAPAEVKILGDSSEAVLMRVVQPSPTPGVITYRATSGSSSCQVSATASPPQCLIFRLASGARQKVEIVACLGNRECSEAIIAYGYTIPKGILIQAK